MLLNMAEDLKEYAKIKVSPGTGTTTAESKATDKTDKKEKKPKSVD